MKRGKDGVKVRAMKPDDKHALLTCAQMRAADRAAVAAGVGEATLMENAGRACAQILATRHRLARVLVLCGPGNNGGDGFVLARCLADMGWSVRVSCVVERAALRGAARAMADQWQGPLAPWDPGLIQEADVIVDAIFGAGLDRDLTAPARPMIEAANASGKPILAIDIPSGVAGDTGKVLGCAMAAQWTVTFFRAKPGHWLYPGRALCGEVILADIGIAPSVLSTIAPQTFANHPDLWRGAFPWPRPQDHKYKRGHALVLSGDAFHTGAARLAARGALRAGAGLVTLAGETSALPILAAHVTAIMLARADDPTDWQGLLDDPRKNAVLIGPGAGATMRTQQFIRMALMARKACVLDADGLTAFADDPSLLFSFIKGPTVLTPHQGEFARLFPDLEGDKLRRVRQAAQRSGAVVLLKGPDTVIAAPDGRAIINGHAPPWLATAGSGDVLAGFIAGLMAAGMDPFPAAACAVWMHGQTAHDLGPGMIAEDLPDAWPHALQAWKANEVKPQGQAQT